MALYNKLIQIWKARDLRNNILFVLIMLVIFRFAAHIPVPGVDTSALKDFFGNNIVVHQETKCIDVKFCITKFEVDGINNLFEEIE